MSDPRLEKLASILINYSLEIQPGQQLMIRSNTLAEELVLPCYREALKAGAHVFLRLDPPESEEIFYNYASDEQIDFISPALKMIWETFDAVLSIGAEQNTRALTNSDPERAARRARAAHPYTKVFYDRAARKEARWCYTVFPTHASAQEANMSLSEFREFVYAANKLNEPDPVAAWRAEGLRQLQLADWLAGKDQVVLKGNDIDLRMSIKGRTFVTADGKYNMPDGEIFTGPVEDSVNGWVRFRYPLIWMGREVTGVELWFEDGKVVREKADSGLELLTSMLNMDAGARYLGELGIGTNYSIPSFVKDILFDEKLGGTIHLAVGESYPETGGKNESGLHWDMICDMADAEITVDGEPFYRNGKPLAWD